MKTFEEYQAVASRVPISLRNNRDRIDFPVMGLQEDAGKIGSLVGAAFANGKFKLTPEQSLEVRNSLSDILWCVALLCHETGFKLEEVAEHSASQLQSRARDLDSDQR